MVFDPNDWANKLVLTIDSSKVDQDLTDFPVLIALSSGTGITNFDASAVLTELTPASGTLASGTVFLTHVEGSDSSTSFTDESSSSHTITATADAQISTAQYRFGASSVYFDGTGDYLDVSYNSDFEFGTGDFTIDFWIYQTASFGAGKDLMSSNRLAGTSWLIHASSAMNFYHNGAAIFAPSFSEVLNTWQHWAIVRSGDNMYFFINGVQIGATGTGHSARSINGSTYLRIGGDSLSMTGYMDEIRISKGVARWTSNFILPTGSYGSSWDNRKKIAVTTNVSPGIYDAYTKLVLHMDDVDLSDSSSSNHNITIYGDTTRSGAQSKFGGFSAFFDGDGDFLFLDDSPDWDLGSTEDFTIDFWIYPTDNFTSFKGILGTDGVSNSWTVYTNGTGVVRVTINEASSDVVTSSDLSLSLDTWQHVAIIRKGAGATDLNIYIDGVAGNSPASGNVSFDSIGEGLAVGKFDANPATLNFYMTGYMDELRISKGIARWTSDFSGSLPSSAYQADTEPELPVEIDYWDSVNNKATLWTKVPTISSGTDTTLNVYYDSTQDDSIYVGDTGDSIAQEVWDSNFVGVWHLGQVPVNALTDVIRESTSNTNDGTPVGSMTSNDLVNGKIGKALNFDGSDDHLTVPDSANWDFGTDDFTLKSWIRLDSIPSVGRMIARGDVTGTNGDWAWGVGTTWGGGTKFNFADYSGGVTDHLSDALSLSTDTWYHFIVARDSGTLRFFLDNVAVGTASCAHSLNSSDIIYIGCRDDAGTVEFFPGDLDKVTISKGIYRSLSWQKATYYSELDDLITYSPIEPTIFTFSIPIPAHSSTVYGLSHTLRLTTTITGADTSYVYSATFFDGGNTQIGSTVAGLNSGDQASSTSPLATPAGTDYSWYVTATSSGESDTSQTYTFTNRFLAEGYTEIDSTRVSGVPVRLYRRSTGVLVGSDTSAGISGTFSIETTFNESHYAVALHPTDSGTNALIFDYVTP